MEAAFRRFLGQSVTEEDNCPAPTKNHGGPHGIRSKYSHLRKDIRGSLTIGTVFTILKIKYICVVVISGLSTCISLIHEAYRTDSASACELS